MKKLEKISSLISTQPAILIAIFLMAFFFRYWHITSTGWVDDKKNYYLGMRSTNHSVFHSSDAFLYERLAKDINNKKGMNLPFHPPMTSIILSFIFLITNNNYFYSKVIYSILSSITCLLTYRIGATLFDKTTGIVAALLSSISFGLIILNGSLNTETLFSFLSMVSLLYMVKTVPVHKKFLLFLCGSVFGITILTRTEFLLTIIFYFLWIGIQKNLPATQKVKKILLISSGILVTVIPWMGRNYLYLTQYNNTHTSHILPVFVPFTLNGPLNFAIGNNPSATGGYNLDFLGKKIDHPKKYNVSLNMNNPVHKKYLLSGNAEGIKFIIKNRYKFLDLLTKKFIIFKDFLRYGVGGHNFPGGLSGYRRSVADCFVPYAHFILIPNCIFFIGGLIVTIKEKGGGGLLPFFFIVSILFINLIFFGLTRSAVVFLPIVFLYQAVFIKKILLDKINKLAGDAIKIPISIVYTFVFFFILLLGYRGSKRMTIMKEVYKKGSMEIKIIHKNLLAISFIFLCAQI